MINSMQDMTSGRPISHIWRYALPVLLGNWLQLLYNAVDSMIAGRFIGKDALAAEGVAGPVMNLFILAITGMCIGAGVLMSERFGAKDFQGLRKVLGTMLSLGCGISVTLGALAIAVSPLITAYLSVPDEIRGMTTLYLRITCLGIPFTFLYNALASALKSVGDSKTPLYFLAFSSVLNAVLDLIFLGALGFGIVCSAVTTVVAEAASALMAMIYTSRKVRELFPRPAEMRMDRTVARQILRYGGPTALQQAVQPVGKLVIQKQVNLLGVHAIAAFNAVTRMDDFACIPEQGIASAVSTFIAQNRGAKKEHRAMPGFLAGLRLELAYWVLVGIVTFLLRNVLVGAFVAGEGAEEVVALGAGYLRWMALFYLWPAINNCVQGYFRGHGKMLVTFVATTVQITVRALMTWLLAPRIGLQGIAFASVIGWSCMMIWEVPLLIHHYHKQKKRFGSESSSVSV